jgi:4a-hydroxytetrahydrobiopterin dehydratase
MSTDLAAKECVPCRGGVPPLEGRELEELHRELDAGWEVVDEHHLEKAFELEDWVSAVDFVDEIARLAEEQGHHPDLHLSWGRVGVQIWTHKIDGLTESDFILAAKIEEL